MKDEHVAVRMAEGGEMTHPRVPGLGDELDAANEAGVGLRVPDVAAARTELEGSPSRSGSQKLVSR
jgi:hypothetical protein